MPDGRDPGHAGPMTTSHLSPKHLALHTILRAVVLTVVAVALQASATVWGASDDSGLGTGLIIFAVLGGLALAWAVVDGVRESWIALAVWAIAALPTGLLMATALGFGTGLPARLVLADLAGSGLFMAALIGLPAVLGATAGSAFAATLPTRRS